MAELFLSYIKALVDTMCHYPNAKDKHQCANPYQSKKLVLEYQCKEVTNTGAHIISHCFISANITVKEDSYFFFSFSIQGDYRLCTKNSISSR